MRLALMRCVEFGFGALRVCTGPVQVVVLGKTTDSDSGELGRTLPVPSVAADSEVIVGV